MHFHLNQIALRELLQEQVTAKQARNPAYSIRSFSRSLKISHSALSEILRGKRKVGTRLGLRIAEALMLDQADRQKLFTQSRKASPRKALELAADQFSVIADWHHFALLSLAETKGFRSEPAWIARRLGCTLAEATAAIERLLRLGLLQQKGRKLSVSGQSLAAPDGIPNAAIRRSHQQFLAHAQQALETLPLEERDFTTITVAGDPARLPEARERIRKFRDELSAFLDGGAKKEVFQLGLQLIPLTREV